MTEQFTAFVAIAPDFGPKIFTEALYRIVSHGTGFLWLYRDTWNFKSFIGLLEKDTIPSFC